MGKKDVWIALGAVCAAIILAVTQFWGLTIETGAWGLSFRTEGQPPTGPAGSKQLAQYDAVYLGDETQKVIYLTFDSGYENGCTEKVLDVLKKHNAPAAFFLVGNYIEKNADLVRRMVDEGHIVGNHMVNHKRSTLLTAQQFVDEMQGLEDLFYANHPNADPMIYYRPPYGNCNEYTLRLADKMGYKTVMWSYTYMDYDTNNQPSYADAMAKVKSGLHPGAVYLFHTESTANNAILGDFIDWARAQGYEFLPVCDIK